MADAAVSPTIYNGKGIYFMIRDIILKCIKSLKTNYEGLHRILQGLIIDGVTKLLHPNNSFFQNLP